MIKRILALSLLILVFLCGCTNNGNEGKNTDTVDYCDGKKCFKCGKDAETWIYGGVAEAYTPSDRYENTGGTYRIFYCRSCFNNMPEAENPLMKK